MRYVSFSILCFCGRFWSGKNSKVWTLRKTGTVFPRIRKKSIRKVSGSYERPSKMRIEQGLLLWHRTILLAPGSFQLAMAHTYTCIDFDSFHSFVSDF